MQDGACSAAEELDAALSWGQSSQAMGEHVGCSTITHAFQGAGTKLRLPVLSPASPTNEDNKILLLSKLRATKLQLAARLSLPRKTQVLFITLSHTQLYAFLYPE